MVLTELQRHPNWRFAESVLREVLPGSTGFDPDQIAGLSPDVWDEFEIDDREPMTVNTDLLAYCRSLIAFPLIVVTLHSYQPTVGPFLVSAEGLQEFVATYGDYFNDVLAAGDVVVVSPISGTVVVVHHSGLIATVLGRSVWRFAINAST